MCVFSIPCIVLTNNFTEKTRGGLGIVAPYLQGAIIKGIAQRFCKGVFHNFLTETSEFFREEDVSAIFSLYR